MEFYRWNGRNTWENDLSGVFFAQKMISEKSSFWKRNDIYLIRIKQYNKNYLRTDLDIQIGKREGGSKAEVQLYCISCLCIAEQTEKDKKRGKRHEKKDSMLCNGIVSPDYGSARAGDADIGICSRERWFWDHVWALLWADDRRQAGWKSGYDKYLY